MPAAGEKAAQLGGSIGDGLIGVVPGPVVKTFEQSGGKGKPKYGQVTVSYARSESEAQAAARKWWPNAAYTHVYIHQVGPEQSASSSSMSGRCCRTYVRRWPAGRRPQHRRLWKGMIGDPLADKPDPGLLSITVEEVLEALGNLPQRPRVRPKGLAGP